MNIAAGLELGETQWHDARLRRLAYSIAGATAEVVLEMEVYANREVRERHSLCIRAIDVQEFVLCAKGSELREQFGAGNVIQGQLHESESAQLSVYLTGGYIRIVAREIERCE